MKAKTIDKLLKVLKDNHAFLCRMERMGGFDMQEVIELRLRTEMLHNSIVEDDED